MRTLIFAALVMLTLSCNNEAERIQAEKDLLQKQNDSLLVA